MYNLNRLSSNSHIRKILKNVRSLSTEIALKTDPLEELIKDINKVSRITTSKVIQKKPQRPPFVKNLFLGQFDREVLTYPELPDKETVAALVKDIEPVHAFFADPYALRERKLSRRFLENLAKLNVLGLQASSTLGCRQLSLTEACRFNECISHNTSRTSVTSNESLGIQTLLKGGSEFQKTKYLQSLIDGQTVVAHCISEPQAVKRTTATLSKDKKYWVLNGVKSWIVNGDTADLFVVLAQTEVPDEHGLSLGRATTFLVERSFGGVTSTPCDMIGLDQTDVSDVQFQNTPIPVDNIIGTVNKGEDVVGLVLSEFRLTTGTACITLLRKVIEKFVQHCVELDAGTDNTTSSSEAMQATLGEITTALYAIESVTYLTSLLIDIYENQDCELEAAIVKAFSAEYCHKSILKCMKSIGGPAFMSDHWCTQLYRDSLSHLMLNEPNENLKLIIALLGVRHAGINLNEKVKIIRNPLFHPAAAFKHMWEERRHVEDRPRLNLKLNEYLHPSSSGASNLLEYSVLRLMFATQTLLLTYGADVVSQHANLKRLAETVMDIYAMTAVVGRASRSYCIGLQHSNYEMEIANAFCQIAKDRVQRNVKEIWSGKFVTPDESLFHIAKQTFKNKGYFPVHPLTRNF